jgi:hypothetical protein
MLNDSSSSRVKEGQYQIKEEPAKNTNVILKTKKGQLVGNLHDETNTEHLTAMDDVLNMAMTDLHIASGQDTTQQSAGNSTSKRQVKGPR